ncbi:MAG: FHA domain-containing protein, partial [Myxococcota bacterium]
MSTPQTESVTATRVLNRSQGQVWVHRALQLEVESGPRSGEVIAVTPGELRIGSGPEADFVLEDAAISALHCTLTLSDSGLWLTDQDSTNGTRIDGVRVARAELHAGARVRLGTTVLALKVGEAEENVSLSARTNFGALL